VVVVVVVVVLNSVHQHVNNHAVVVSLKDK
jgi:hypothetical protein